jgi:hypothetical protein
MELKTCGSCKIELPKTQDYFRKRSENKNNLRSDCKNCFDEKSRKRHVEFYRNNTEKEKERQKKWISENKERRAKTVHKTYLKNIDKVKEYDKKRINDLTDSIIINRIVTQTGLTKNEIPKELIKTKRLITQLKRTIKN